MQKHLSQRNPFGGGACYGVIGRSVRECCCSLPEERIAAFDGTVDQVQWQQESLVAQG